MSIRSINSVLKERKKKKKKNKPISLLHCYTGLRRVCEVHDFFFLQIEVTAFFFSEYFSKIRGGQSAQIYAPSYGKTFIVPSNVFVQSMF